MIYLNLMMGLTGLILFFWYLRHGEPLDLFIGALALLVTPILLQNVIKRIKPTPFEQLHQINSIVCGGFFSYLLIGFYFRQTFQWPFIGVFTMAIFLTLLDFLFFAKSVQPIQSDRHLNLPTFYSQQLQSRVFDLFFATLLGIISFPLVMTSCLLILVIDRRTPFFKQQRVGFNGTLFVIYKLQTLNPVDLRPSILGAFLRTYNLDELPQLWNVLKGDMSLVGPRPEIPDKAKQFTAKQNQRHQVRPGITGYWQLSDHRQHPIADYAELDLLYVSTRNLWVDISILVATPFLMFQTSGPLKNVDLKKVS